jgi:hypothetical protein
VTNHETISVRMFQRLLLVLIENQVERESIEAILQAEGLVDVERLEGLRAAMRSQMSEELANLRTIDTIDKLDAHLARFSSLRMGPKEGP